MATKDLDFGNVIKQVYDPPTESLKVLATISIGSITVDLDAATDSVRLGDGSVLSTFTTIGPKNALDVNIAGGTLALTIDQADDSIRLGDGTTLFTGTTVGPKTGLDVNLLNSSLAVTGPLTDAELRASAIEVTTDLEAFTGINPDNVQLVGSIDGTKTGTKYGFVNNIRQQILSSQDREQAITYADFGTKDQRIVQIDYTSSTFPGFTVQKIINYTLVSGRYRRDSIEWQIV